MDREPKQRPWPGNRTLRGRLRTNPRNNPERGGGRCPWRDRKMSSVPRSSSSGSVGGNNSSISISPNILTNTSSKGIPRPVCHNSGASLSCDG
ncbi:hypothetical protein VUR80DRAFT_9030 [Thermomyces stellatus]